MSVIDPTSNNYFKSASYVFSKVKRDLSSFADANLIDEGEFPTYVKEILRLLGLAVYKENDAVVKIKNYKAQLPSDFSQLYAAYKCSPYFSGSDIAHQQGSPISVYNDVTWELLEASGTCDIEPTCREKTTMIEHISVRQYVQEKAFVYNFKNPILLRISPNVRKDRCAEDCANSLSTSPFEFSLTDGFIYTNFNDDFVYLKYYAFPKDEDGVPMILDNERLEKCIEWYIKYQLMLNWWHNNSVPNLENRWQQAQFEYEKWLGEIKYERKMPAFAQMINTIRRNRAVNKIAIFAK